MPLVDSILVFPKFCEMKTVEPFIITEDKLDTGLRGVPVGYCPTSDVDPMLGLSYGGRLIPELAHKEPEEVIYLLLHRAMPTAEQLANFKKEFTNKALN